MSINDRVNVIFSTGEFCNIRRRDIFDKDKNDRRSLKKAEKVEFLFNRIWYVGTMKESWISASDMKKSKKIKEQVSLYSSLSKVLLE